jgi:hypothetical protein
VIKRPVWLDYLSDDTEFRKVTGDEIKTLLEETFYIAFLARDQ